MWQLFSCGDVKGGVYHVRRLQIEWCGELDCCLVVAEMAWCGAFRGGLFMPECSGGLYSVVSCNSPFR